MPYCPTCNEWAYGPGHECPPQWNVWPEGDEEGLHPGDSYEFYADNAESAAIKFGESMSDDGPERWTVYVREVGDERQQAERYELDYYIQAVFSATLKPKS